MTGLTLKLSDEYRRLFDTLEIRAERESAADREADKALSLKGRYQTIGDPIGIPWFFIAAVHMRESSWRVDRHLHNGDPLSARTVNVPAARPKRPDPPYSFEQSAADALIHKRLDQWGHWSLPRTLYKLEAYNGFGYRNHNLPSPYLWSFSHHYLRGKYVRDGQFDPAAVDRQCGTATLLRRLAERQEIAFADEPALDQGVLVVRYAHSKPTDANDIERASALQHWLNTFPGIYLKVDGWPGQRTSAAFHAVTGSWLPGDPRAE
jgi:lysozyme family protein